MRKGQFTQVDIRKRFEDKYIPEPNSGCWLWIAATNNKGYGQIWHNGKLARASNVSWMLHHGIFPPMNLFVLHKCDNPPCVNPNHLFLGTASDNMLDMYKKGRAYYQKYPERCNLIGRNKNQTHCLRGHALDIENTRVNKHGHRNCKKCIKLREARLPKRKHR